jgi:hypothetical protein
MQHSFITPYTPVMLREANVPSGSSSVHHVFYKDLDAEIAELRGKQSSAYNTFLGRSLAVRSRLTSLYAIAVLSIRLSTTLAIFDHAY